MAKSQLFNKEEIYPLHWTDEDKINFDDLLFKSKLMYPNYDEFIMKLAITAHINREKGVGVPLDLEEAERLKKLYLDNVKAVYETPKEK